MIYTTQVILKIPESLQDLANNIAKAFDPDTGGDKTFNVAPVDGFITTTFPCVQDFANALPFFLESPMALYSSVVRDYELRWVELTPPTLADCQLFCTSVQIIPQQIESTEYVTLGS